MKYFLSNKPPTIIAQHQPKPASSKGQYKPISTNDNEQSINVRT
jgi:hypothetical protein